MGYYALTVFLSAFLLFQIQPLIGKYILPWFGGTPSVWSAAMLFFQTLLMGGYAYAHWLIGRLGPRRQGVVHLALLGVSLGLLLVLGLVWDSPITPDAHWRPQGAEGPQWQTLRILAMAVGLPYFILSASNPLMQAWFNYRQSGHSPYRLYALSNAGSLLGLVSFPFLVEPLLALKAQANLWVWGYVVFATCAACVTLRTMRPVSSLPPDHGSAASGADRGSRRADENRYSVEAAPVGRRGTATELNARSPTGEGARPGVGVQVFWVALSACASVMLLATTSQVSLKLPATPFLWVLPLALYLLSFILCFSSRPWYSRIGYTVALMIGTTFFCWAYCYGRGTLLAQVGVYSLILFVCCMICHGELARLKPRPRYLTRFYMLISLGGALGGILVNLVAPIVFAGFWELPLGLAGCWMLLLIAFASGGSPGQNRWLHLLNEGLFRGLEIGIVLLGLMLFSHVRNSSATVRWSSRDFFGVSWVKELNANAPAHHAHALVHNGTVHGFQYVDEERRALPTAYYTEESGMGLAILHHTRGDAGLRVGAVGLGVGTLAAYGRPGDTIRFYEISPDVIRVAEGEGGYFTYLKDCPAQVEIVPGDARISMERELTEGDLGRFDLLVVDAFNSGSTPVHLLTKEAFEIYLAHLQPDGVIALHISNRHMDLRPVVQGLADHFQLGTAFIINDGGGGGRGYWSAWMLVTRSEQFLEQPEIVGRTSPQPVYDGFRLWTDDYSSVFSTLLTGEPLAEGLLGDSESPRDIGGDD